MDRKTLDRLLTYGVKNGASDLHFLVGDRPSFRVDGTLRHVKSDPLGATDTRHICECLLGDARDHWTGLGEDLVRRPADIDTVGVAHELRLGTSDSILAPPM